MSIDSLGWKGKRVRRADGIEGVIVSEDINFDYCYCRVRMDDGSRDSFTLCANEDNREARGWSWWCDAFSEGARWLELGPAEEAASATED